MTEKGKGRGRWGLTAIFIPFLPVRPELLVISSHRPQVGKVQQKSAVRRKWHLQDQAGTGG